MVPVQVDIPCKYAGSRVGCRSAIPRLSPEFTGFGHPSGTRALLPSLSRCFSWLAARMHAEGVVGGASVVEQGVWRGPDRRVGGV